MSVLVYFVVEPLAAAPISDCDVPVVKSTVLRDAQRASAGTLRGLDWLNFLLADVQTGVGPFLAIYLAGYGWNEQRVGLALTVGADSI
jgi:hypothetical protein